jgi:hypothetical protein
VPRPSGQDEKQTQLEHWLDAQCRTGRGEPIAEDSHWLLHAIQYRTRENRTREKGRNPTPKAQEPHPLLRTTQLRARGKTDSAPAFALTHNAEPDEGNYPSQQPRTCIGCDARHSTRREMKLRNPYQKPSSRIRCYARRSSGQEEKPTQLQRWL